MQESLFHTPITLSQAKAAEIGSALLHKIAPGELNFIWLLIQAPVNTDVFVNSTYNWAKYWWSLNGQTFSIEFNGENSVAQRFIRMFLHVKSYKQFVWTWANEWVKQEVTKNVKFQLNGDIAQMSIDQYRDGEMSPEEAWLLR